MTPLRYDEFTWIEGGRWAMPRRARVFVAGATYHVYCRTTRGEAAFAEPAEAGDLVEVIREVKREHGLSVLAWCVMATHYHLAVRTDRQPLWRSMRLVQGRFARRHNRRQRTFGPFWQGRYKAIVVADERYLRQLLAYIHLNPVVAGAVSDPARYRWSGHRELLGASGQPLVDAAEALVLFGARREAARRAYVRAIKGERREAWIGERPGALPWWRAGEADAEITLPEGRRGSTRWARAPSGRRRGGRSGGTWCWRARRVAWIGKRWPGVGRTRR